MMIKFFEPKINTLDNLKYLGMALKSNFLNENNLTKKLVQIFKENEK
ncbi:hypothetical protein N9A15_03515 [Candidatus Pelagibacter sp.]|jgi:hypothetical protein|nr:hypothetical protein [Candidatus Pelagibacter sp.]